MGSRTKFFVKQRFPSFIRLKQHIERYERENNFMFLIRHSRTISSSSLTNINKELVYYDIQYSCVQGGNDTNSNASTGSGKMAISKLECPVKISLRASLDGKVLEVYSFIDKHNHEVKKHASSETSDPFEEDYKQNITIKSYLEKMKEKYKCEASEKKYQLAMTESLIKILNDQINSFKIRQVGFQENLKKTQNELMEMRRILATDKPSYDQLTLELKNLKKINFACEDEFNHILVIRISLEKMIEEYRCEVAEKNRQLVKTESMIKKVDDEIEEFRIRETSFQEDLWNTENELAQMQERQSEEEGELKSINPAFEDIKAIRISVEKMKQDAKKEDCISDQENVSLDSTLHADNSSEASDPTYNSESATSDSDSELESTPAASTAPRFKLVATDTVPRPPNAQPKLHASKIVPNVSLAKPVSSQRNVTLNAASLTATSPPASKPLMAKKRPLPATKAHSCTECFKTFKKTFLLNRHMITHTGIKPYTCLMCNKAFSRKHHLERHRLIHAKMRSRLTYKKVFARKRHLGSHKKGVQGKKQVYPCSRCEKCFAQNKDRLMHEKIHDGQSSSEENCLMQAHTEEHVSSEESDPKENICGEELLLVQENASCDEGHLMQEEKEHFEESFSGEENNLMQDVNSEESSSE